MRAMWESVKRAVFAAKGWPVPVQAQVSVPLLEVNANDSSLVRVRRKRSGSCTEFLGEHDRNLVWRNK